MLGSFICFGKLCAHKLWHPKIHLSSILGLKKTDPTKTPGHRDTEASSATTVCAFNVWWSYRSRETFRRWNHRVLHQPLESACVDVKFKKAPKKLPMDGQERGLLHCVSILGSLGLCKYTYNEDNGTALDHLNVGCQWHQWHEYA